MHGTIIGKKSDDTHSPEIQGDGIVTLSEKAGSNRTPGVRIFVYVCVSKKRTFDTQATHVHVTLLEL